MKRLFLPGDGGQQIPEPEWHRRGELGEVPPGCSSKGDPSSHTISHCNPESPLAKRSLPGGALKAGKVHPREYHPDQKIHHSNEICRNGPIIREGTINKNRGNEGGNQDSEVDHRGNAPAPEPGIPDQFRSLLSFGSETPGQPGRCHPLSDQPHHREHAGNGIVFVGSLRNQAIALQGSFSPTNSRL